MSAKQFIALLNSHVAGDEDQFLSIALQVAAQEARSGNAAEAEKLKRIVQRLRDRASDAPKAQSVVPMARPRGELLEFVQSAYPKTGLDGMVLADRIRARLDRVVRQQSERALLRDHGRSRLAYPARGTAGYREDNDSGGLGGRASSPAVHGSPGFAVQPVFRRDRKPAALAVRPGC